MHGMTKQVFLEGDVMDCLQTLPDDSVHCVVTSPPYWGLRSYLADDDIRKPLEIGTEISLDEYVAKMVKVFGEVKRVLRPRGTLWLVIGDSYNGSGGAGRDYNTGGLREGQPRYPGRDVSYLKPKDMCGVPWRVAFALQEDGWWLRSATIWAKPNPFPSPVSDRPTSSYEFVFLLAKSQHYFYDHERVKEERVITVTSEIVYGGTTRNLRDVWTISPQPFPSAHFAVFPERLAEICIKAGTSKRGCCPKCGAPWERLVKRTKVKISDSKRYSGVVDRNDAEDSRFTHLTDTIGWQPTCECDLAPVPCVTLDPFGGSGTVAKVSRDLGLNSIYIDLNPEYVKMAMERVGESLFNEIERRVVGDDKAVG